MVEIGDDGRFLQAFEFSEDGSTPPSSFPKREPAFIENIRKTAERSFAQSRARGGGSESSVVRLATRKLVVESDAEDNILRVLELPSETSILPPSKRRAESPFSQRQESLARVERRAGGSSKRGREREQSPFSKEEADGTPAGSIPAAVTSKNAEDVPSSRKDRENHRGTAEDKNEYIRHPGPIIDSLSRQTSSRSSSSRSSSLSRPRSARHKAYRSRPSRSLSRTGALRLRSSLRDSSVGRAAVRKGSGDSSSPPTVRFALDNDGGTASSQKAAELNVSESSFGSTGSLGSSRVSRGRDRNHKGSDLLSSPATRVALVDGEGASSLKAVGFNESETSFGSTRCYGSIRGSKGRDRSNKSSDLLSPPATRLAHNDGKGASSSKTADLNTSDTSFGSTISSRSSHDSGGRAPLMVARSSCRAGRSRSPPKNDVNVALETSQRSFESMESNKNFVSAKSVSFLVDQQDAGNDIMSAPTSSQKSNQDSPSSTPPPQLPSHGRSDGARDDHDELRPRRLESFGTDQDASLAGSIPSDFRAAYHQGKPVLSSQDHHAHPQHVFPRPSRSLSNISENSNESSMESRRSDQNFESGQDVYERSLAHAALNPQPPPRRGKSKSFLDTSERSNTENDGPMYAIRHDSGESGIDTSDRSDDSRRSVSFATNLQDEGGRKRAAEVERSPNGFASGWTHAYPPPPPPRGRTSSSFHSYGTDECLPEVRRVRSLSRGQAPGVRADDSVSLVIDDSSSLTATGNDQSSSSSRRAPSGQGDGRGGIPSAPPRQTRSLSRTREKVTISNIGFRDVNFDPAASVASSHQGNYHEHKRSTEAFDPDLKKMSVKKSMVSHSTEETFISAVSDAEGTRFTNQTAGAVRVQEEGDPFMNSSLLNSSLTIFLSECDDEEQSLLSDPTISADLLPPGVALQDVQESLMERPSASTRETVKVHVSKEDSNEALRWSSSKEVSKQERRSRIRRMLSRKASTKRQNGTAPVGGPKVNHSLDSSEETRETFVSKDGSSPGVWMEGAQESLLLHQSLAARGWQQQHPDQGSDRSRNKQKSRLSRLLKR